MLLLTYVAEALNADGAVGPSVFKAISSDSLWSKGLPRLGAALASRQEPLVLVLDDVHELENHDCLDALVALLPHVPLRLTDRLLRADGGEPRVPEAARRGRAARARACHPRAQRRGGACSPRRRRRRCDRRRGARPQRPRGGLGSRALSRRSVGRQRRLVGVVAPWRRPLLDRLPASEELERADPAEVEFLLRTSVLDRMCAPLCDAVLERHDSSQMLERLERDNLFVVPLDHERRWFRYHHLFGEMLQAELERREPELVATLNGRAAAWCKANGHARGRDRVRRGGGRRGRARVTRHGERVPVLPGRQGNDGRALAGDVRRRGAAPAIPGHRRLRGVDPRAAGTSGRGRALGARGGEPPLRRLDARRQPGRRVGGNGARAPVQERRRTDAARRRRPPSAH